MADIRVKVRHRINESLNVIEQKMKAHEHMTNTEEVLNLISDVEALWNYMNEDDREFIGAVRYAIRTQTRWD
jgi:hypothetical protein